MSDQPLNDVAKATLQQFNAAIKKIENRDQQIAELEKKAADTLSAASLYAECKVQIKELKKLNQSDRDFVAQAIGFYEDITGKAVGTGDLFNQEKEHED